ncbi:MAG: ribonuclease E/G [Clostridia bacterium]|nr:ribonuclease E/G [Clostridia bacterium]
MGLDVYYGSVLDTFSEIAITKDGEIIENLFFRTNTIVGSIIVGKVIRIDKTVGIFMDIGRELNALLKYRNGIKIGDYLPVRVSRDENVTKGAVVTEELSLVGRYAIVNKTGEYRFSRRLSEEEKIKLFKISPKDGIGCIYRSNCRYASIEEIEEEVNKLSEQLNEIEKQAKNTYSIKTLYKISIDSIASRYVAGNGKLINSLEPIMDQVLKLRDKKVIHEGLKIVIEQTEAMATIDINKHRFKSKYADVDEAIKEANTIALKEAYRQIKLRNLSGIIAIDIISQIKKSSIDDLKVVLDSLVASDNLQTTYEFVENACIFVLIRKKMYDSFI